MTPVYVYRLVVTIPVEFQRPGWEPEGWDLYGDPDDRDPDAPSFSWPTRRHFLSRSGAANRADLLRSWGATVEIERSRPVEWDEATP